MMDDILKSIYYDPAQWASFSSVQQLYRAAKHINPKFTLRAVKRWLQAQNVYTLHKPLKKRFVRRKTISKGLYYQMQMDLVDLSSIKSKNKNMRYLLTAIDIFNRKAFAVPLKTKQGVEVVKALKQIFLNYPKVKFIQTDEGKEFLNQHVKTYLKENNMSLFTTSSDTKSSIVERFNRTLKNRMFKYFTAYNTLNYLSVLDNILNAYNNNLHRSIGTSPNKVNTRNEQRVWDFQYKQYLQKYGTKKYQYDKGDIVRITKYRKEFRKGYLPTYQEEYFKVHERINTYPPTYKLTDMNNESIRGTFYAAEIQTVLPVRGQYKILKSRKTKKQKEFLVHFIGYPSTQDKWMQKKELNHLENVYSMLV